MFYYNDNADRHRIDGPAMIKNGIKRYWINNQELNCYNNEEFQKLLKLQAFW